METYQSFYQNEVRALELTIDDQDGSDFAPSAAFTQVVDESNTVVIAEQAALVTGSNVRTTIGTTVTGTVGTYKVIWRILKSGHTYYHVTVLTVQEI
jgi:hypothetical protein